MGKTARQIEAEIHMLLRACSREARGVWTDMRYFIDHESKRPGHLQRDGQPITQSQLANIAGCDCTAVAPLLRELEHAGLVSRVGEGNESTFHSPPLTRLSSIRAGGVERTMRWKRRKASVDTRVDAQVDAPVDAKLTPRPPVPASSSPPTPPSPTPPNTPTPTAPQGGRVRERERSRGGGGGGAGVGGGVDPRTAEVLRLAGLDPSLAEEV